MPSLCIATIRETIMAMKESVYITNFLIKKNSYQNFGGLWRRIREIYVQVLDFPEESKDWSTDSGPQKTTMMKKLTK